MSDQAKVAEALNREPATRAPKGEGQDSRDLVIEVRGLRKSYDSVEAVAGIDLEVRAGEVFAFLGPNGAGKTTTVEILEGYRRRSAGEVSVLGCDPAKAGRDWRARIGVVLQESEPEAELTAGECLALYAGYYPAPRPVGQTLELVGLADRRNTRCGAMSGGQRRRLDVALALIGDPELVFLDEPTTGLDPAARRMMWDLVKQIQAQGKSVMLTTHYMEEATELCDRVAIMDHGHILEMGPVPELIGRRFKERAVYFDTAAALPLEKVQKLEGVTRASQEDGQTVLYSRDVPATIGTLLALADEARVDPHNLGIRQATLEDVFLDLTGRALRD